ncbi:non-specific serine/threonine protein kinase [Salvia divinorum]|uniref:Non-specific serine/threonine protein kinase n=1 Tax=Salvia divinorum TaxID=28513 RepID=A0ABD1H4C7_SALDI
MHGRIQRGDESSRSLKGSCSQHMRSVPRLATADNSVASAGDNHSPAASSITNSTTGSSFFKDGRKISVGDSALFNPLNNSPPFIGLIRWLELGKENNLQLGVNRLYRSSELKLGKGPLPDSVPNEIFYSSYKDKIPAASLLHPCKVAFLPRGAELPTGTACFVCRRAYDIGKKCLRWLTDQDYINEQQEEVDKLLYQTRKEMHVTLHPSGRSPKQATTPTSTSQLKPSSDSGQNSGTSIPSQNKGKKRGRVDHGADPVKRERSSRTDEGDSGQCRKESTLKYEIARITENGGVADVKGVEKLVQLMQSDQMERKNDLVNRVMFARAMASTDKADCLSRFVELRGVLVMDEWLQDIHKGKISNGNPKDGDKSAEDFLLILLRALDKLPISLHALQMCNIGRSVNHLRSHKNTDIQRKARTLVDTWKKRVEAEMMGIDTKSAWSSKSRLPEASHGGSITPSGSDVAMKSSIPQNSAIKPTSVKSSHGDTTTKYVSSHWPVKQASSLASGKESQSRTSVGGTADAHQNREDRSSSSNQSHNCGQSSSSKENLKSSASGSGTVKKVSCTRNRKLSSSSGRSASGSPKETNSKKNSSAHKSTAKQKFHSALTSERVVEGPINEGSSHKLIVKIPNRIRSPAQGANGGSLEVPTVMSSRASSPVLNHEQHDDPSKGENGLYQCNAVADMKTCQTSDLKDALTGSEGAGSPAVPPDEEQSMTTEDSKRTIEGPTATLSKLVKSHSSFSPMNALIESCAKYSEATSSLSREDDVGMNLLASVAAGELSRSDVGSPANSTERSIPVADEVCNGSEAKSKFSVEDSVASERKQHAGVEGCSWSNDRSHLSRNPSPEFSGDRKCSPSYSSRDASVGEGTKDFGSSSTNLRSNADVKLEAEEKPNKKTVAVPISLEKVRDSESGQGNHEEKATACKGISDIPKCSSGGTGVMVTEEKCSAGHFNNGECKPMAGDEGSDPLLDGDCIKLKNERLSKCKFQQKVTAAVLKSEHGESNEKLYQTGWGHKPVSEVGDAVKVREPDDMGAKSCMSKSEQLDVDEDVDINPVNESHSAAVVCSISNDLNNDIEETNVGNQATLEQISPPQRRCPISVDFEGQKEVELARFASASTQQGEVDKFASTCDGAASCIAEGAAVPGAKMKFDLNEFSAEDVKYGDSLNKSSPTLSTVHMNSLAIPTSSIIDGNSASVTIAAAAKGSFVPPENLLRSKVELGWKGSAATSAFRPAEPKRSLEMPLGLTNLSCSDSSTSKHDRISLDFDLNVADERVLEEIASSGSALAVGSTTESASNCANDASDSLPVRGSCVLDFDLNRVDETNDIGICSTSSKCDGQPSIMHEKPLGGFHVQRDFDLNNGPVADNAGVNQFMGNQLVNGNFTSQLPSAGVRMNGPVLSSFSSWFPSGGTYSTVTVPSILPERLEQPFPMFPPGAQPIYGSAGVSPFNPDMYRGSVLSSSPTVPYGTNSFQFPVFPFGTSYPLPSTPFTVGATSYVDSSSGARLFAPPVNSQYLGPIGSFASQFQRPYMVSLPDISNNGGLESNRKWGRQGLDLNAGPGVIEIRTLYWRSRTGCSASGNILKRKEPDGSWDDTFRNRQPSLQ